MAILGSNVPVESVFLRYTFSENALEAADGVAAIGTGVWKGGKEFGDGEVEDRMAKIRSDLGQRGEHEPAPRHLRMRDAEFFLREDEIAVEQQIEVEHARSLGRGSGAVAAEANLQREEHAQQKLGRQSGIERSHGIDEGGLGLKIDGRCLVEGRAASEAAQFLQPVNGRLEGVAGISVNRRKIAAKTDVDARARNGTGRDHAGRGEWSAA